MLKELEKNPKIHNSTRLGRLKSGVALRIVGGAPKVSEKAASHLNPSASLGPTLQNPVSYLSSANYFNIGDIKFNMDAFGSRSPIPLLPQLSLHASPSLENICSLQTLN